ERRRSLLRRNPRRRLPCLYVPLLSLSAPAPLTGIALHFLRIRRGCRSPADAWPALQHIRYKHPIFYSSGFPSFLFLLCHSFQLSMAGTLITESLPSPLSVLSGRGRGKISSHF